ncbi:MAG: hypothetical protein ACLFUJ_10165 [Phycisphaerae bacterium]
MQVTLDVRYPLAPAAASCNTAWVQSVFGMDASRPGQLVIADSVPLEILPGQILLFLGPSGSGKSSLLTETLRQVSASLDPELNPAGQVETRIEPGSAALIDRLDLPADEAAALLTSCGLGEGPLLLRTVDQLSQGQRYRFAVAAAIASGLRTIAADEFCAALDRTCAKVLAGNLRKLADRRGLSFLVATTHEDLTEALGPDTIVRPGAGGCVEVSPQRPFRRNSPLVAGLEMYSGTPADWAYFAGWHYRGKHLGPVRQVVLLFDGTQPAGICVLGPGPLSSSARNRLFGLDRLPRRIAAEVVNRHFVSVTRLVLAPRWRGAGIASRFLRAVACQCDVPWVELASEMGHLSRFAEAAGFVAIGRGRDHLRTAGGGIAPADPGRRGGAYSAANCTPATRRQQARRRRFSRPVCYLFDNRRPEGRSEP